MEGDNSKSKGDAINVLSVLSIGLGFLFLSFVADASANTFNASEELGAANLVSEFVCSFNDEGEKSVGEKSDGMLISDNGVNDERL